MKDRNQRRPEGINFRAPHSSFDEWVMQTHGDAMRRYDRMHEESAQLLDRVFGPAEQLPDLVEPVADAEPRTIFVRSERVDRPAKQQRSSRRWGKRR
jgi:hypothetical protein